MSTAPQSFEARRIACSLIGRADLGTLTGAVARAWDTLPGPTRAALRRAWNEHAGPLTLRDVACDPRLCIAVALKLPGDAAGPPPP